jgi:hypothetical protein
MIQPFTIGDVMALSHLEEFRQIALEGLYDCVPNEVEGLFKLTTQTAAMFMRNNPAKVPSLIMGSLKADQDKQRQSESAIIHLDMVAPYLSNIPGTLGALNMYEEFVGKGRVLSELQYAICHGLIIGDAGLKYANPYINHRPQDWIVGTTPTLYPLNAPLMLPPSQPQPTIGTNTRLTAVEASVVQPVERAVESVAMLPEPDLEWIPEPLKEPVKSAVVAPVYDVAKDLGENPQSAIIAGVPGAGKGMITSNALRALKAKSPEIKIMVIDPKADPKEKAYWEGVCDVYRPRAFGAPTATPEDNTEWLLLRINEFKAMKGPKLLVLDEGLMVCQTLKLAKLFDYQTTPDGKEKAVPIDAFGIFKNFLTYISSLGDSSDVWLWLVTQVINAGDLGISGGMRSIFRAIGIVSPKNRHAVNTFFATGFVPYPPGGLPGAYRLMDESPVERAFYDGKLDKWMSMPELTNHSGWNRDKRASTNAKTTKPPCAKEAQLQALADAGDVASLEQIVKFMEERVAANATAMASLKGRN